MDLGPFKHRVDDGLELRKAAFECLDMLLDSCKDRIQFHDFIQRLVDGLQASRLGWTSGRTACQCVVSAACVYQVLYNIIPCLEASLPACTAGAGAVDASICIAAFCCRDHKQLAGHLEPHLL